MAFPISKSLQADRVSRLRLRDVCGVKADTPVEQVVGRMIEGRTGCVLVLGPDDTVVGIFTEHDYLSRVVAAGLEVATPVEVVMTRAPKTISTGSSVFEAVELMERGGYRHLPVLGDDGRPAGILSVKAIIHYLVEYFPATVYNLPPVPGQSPPAREGA